MTRSNIFGNKLTSSLLRKWIRRASPGGDQARLLIVKYHRADSSMGFSSERHSVGTFEMQAELLNGIFNTLTVTDASRRIKNGTLPPRALCITFDDGYADNFHIALPILKRYGITATFFVPSGLLDQSIMWSDQIASVFATASDKKKVRHFLADAGMPTRYPDLMNKLKYMSLDAQETIVRGLSKFGKVTDDSSRLMNAAQVRSLVEQGMEVGGHTVNHTILTNADDAQAQHEIANCKSQLESIIDSPVVSFAYPNGRRDRDYSQRDVNIVRQAGFEVAVNTEYGLAGKSDELFELPRVAQYFVTPLRLFRMYL